ncbi:MAG: DUF87 domain-containing protein [Thermofilaceae archaeon]
MSRKIKVKLGRFSGNIYIEEGHVVILGRSGAGKSNTAKVVIRELTKRGLPVLVIDWAGEYELSNFTYVRPGDDFSLNVFENANINDAENIDVTVDLFDATFHLTAPQIYILRVAVKNACAKGAKNLVDLLKAVEETPTRSFYDYETKMALVRRLSPLAEGRVGRALSGRVNVGNILTDNIVIDLSLFKSVYAKRLFTLFLLKHIYDKAISRGVSSRPIHATLIEEFWNVAPYRRLDAEPSVGERMFFELRKYGEILIAVTQNPSEVAWGVISNAEVIIVHAMLPKEAEVLGLHRLVPAEQRQADICQFVMRLRKGEAIVIERDRIFRVKVAHARNDGLCTRVKRLYLHSSRGSGLA